jgi:hypothetical protein
MIYIESSTVGPDEGFFSRLLGLAFAERSKNTEEYDHKWPTAYGLERTICALGGACTPPVEAPQNQWNALWDQTKLRVKTYYKVR